jgi:hypothetical protein
MICVGSRSSELRGQGQYSGPFDASGSVTRSSPQVKEEGQQTSPYAGDRNRGGRSKSLVRNTACWRARTQLPAYSSSSGRGTSGGLRRRARRSPPGKALCCGATCDSTVDECRTTFAGSTTNVECRALNARWVTALADVTSRTPLNAFIHVNCHVMLRIARARPTSGSSLSRAGNEVNRRL